MDQVMMCRSEREEREREQRRRQAEDKALALEMKYRVGKWIRISPSDVFRSEGRCTFWRQSTVTLARLGYHRL